MDTLLPLVLSLTQVTVYGEGARYQYVGVLAARKGMTTFLWEGLPLQTDPQSVRVSVATSARGYIVQTSVEPLTGRVVALPPDLEALKKQIDSVEKILSRVRQRLAVLALQEKTLTENTRLGGEEGGTNALEVEKYLALIERRLAGILEEKALLEKQQAQLNDTLTRQRQIYQNRLRGLQAQRSALAITYSAPQAEVVPVRVELSGPPAGWRLSYRIRAFPAENKVAFQRWAIVENRSGEDWRDIQLILSTGKPEAQGTLPPFQPWYVDIFTPLLPLGRAQGRYSEAAAPMYKALADDTSAESSEEPMAPAPPPLPVQTEQTLSRTYDLGRQHVLAGAQLAQFFLQSDTLEAAFRFFINAAAEEAAYLRAGLPMGALSLWEPAPAVVEVDGQEVARLHWSPSPTEDTVWLDLGRSPRVFVKRTQLQDKRESRLTGSTIQRHYAYNLRVSHTYTAPIRLTIWERVPVSRHSDIKVEVTDPAGGVHDAEKGQLTWQVLLTPGETWERTFRFVVKYPRQKQVIGL